MISNEKVKKKDVLFVCVLLIAALLLSLFPSPFLSRDTRHELNARALILEADDSEVYQYGIVKTGDQRLTLQILSGPFRGETHRAVNTLIGKMELDKMFVPGDKALVGIDTDTNNKIVYVSVIDHYRIHIEGLLFALFILLLVIYGGWTGGKAAVSFFFTAVIIWKLMLPGFLLGIQPVLLSLGVVALLTGVIIFLVGGFTKKGVCAFSGAISGVVITCLLSIFFGKGFHIHGAIKPFSETLLYSGFGHIDLTQIFFSGIFLASSGAVMDIAMDVAASQVEVVHNHPRISRKELIISGFKVGRAVVGTMTTTLLLAYSGGYTAMLMVFIAQGTPVKNVLNISYVSGEILHTLVGSFGLVLVAPLTAIIGGFMFPVSISRKA